jgi:hypothetical protein
MKKQTILLFLFLTLFFILFNQTENHLFISFKRANPDLFVIILSSIFSLSLLFIFNFVKKNSMIDPFVFEVSGPKLCDGGPYMYSSNPELKKYCDSLSQDTLNQFECSVGYHGRPVNFSYTPESDADWKNTRCNDVNSQDYKIATL